MQQVGEADKADLLESKPAPIPADVALTRPRRQHDMKDNLSDVTPRVVASPSAHPLAMVAGYEGDLNSMQNKGLTKRQRTLVKELEDLTSLFHVDYQNVFQYEGESRTAMLELAMNQIVRSQIIIYYTFIDEALSRRICRYFFGRRDFGYLWRTKKFQNLNYFVLQELSLMQKLRFVKAITKIPSNINQDIARLNDLRNGIAHAFIPENLRRSKPVWKGKDIFTIQGAKVFQEDMDKLYQFIIDKVWI